MRSGSVLAAAVLVLAMTGCSIAPIPTIKQNTQYDPYADVRIGPISYTTPLGVFVPEKDGWSRGSVMHKFVAHPDLNGEVAYDPQPPSDIKVDGDRRIRAFLAGYHSMGAIRSVQYATRGTAEGVKYTTMGDSKEGAELAGTLILLRQDGKSVIIGVTGPRVLEYEVGAAAESLADAISFTPDGMPARQASPLARHAAEFKEEAANNAAAKAAAQAGAGK
jgi:hypothetical protein